MMNANKSCTCKRVVCPCCPSCKCCDEARESLTLKTKQEIAAWYDFDVPCLRCRFKLEEALCDHCQAQVVIRNKLRSLKSRTSLLPGLLKAVKRFTINADKTTIKPKPKTTTDEYSRFGQYFAPKLSDKSILDEELKSHDTNSKVKPRDDFLQKSTFLRSQKPESPVEIGSHDSIFSPFVTSFTQPYKKNYFRYDFPKEKKLQELKTPVDSLHLITDIVNKERTKTHDDIHPSRAKGRGSSNGIGARGERGEVAHTTREGEGYSDGKKARGERNERVHSSREGAKGRGSSNGIGAGGERSEVAHTTREGAKGEGYSHGKKARGERNERVHSSRDGAKGEDSLNAKEARTPFSTLATKQEKDGKSKGKKEAMEKKQAKSQQKLPTTKGKEETRQSQKKAGPEVERKSIEEKSVKRSRNTGDKEKKRGTDYDAIDQPKEMDKNGREKAKNKSRTSKLKIKDSKKEKSDKAQGTSSKNKTNKLKSHIEIIRPDVQMYDVILPKSKEKERRTKNIYTEVVRLPELMVAFPSYDELNSNDLETLELKTIQVKEYVKNTKLEKNLPKNHEMTNENYEPKSQIYHIMHQFQNNELKDEEIEDGKHTKKKKATQKILYALSERSHIRNGWTQLPVENIVRRMFVYSTRPAQPKFDWFNNKKEGKTFYDTGELLAKVDDRGYGQWYYKNGKIALTYHQSESETCQKRVEVYSNGEPDVDGKTYPVALLAVFDFVGNGIVFDHIGKIRLNYNQTEGIVNDQNIGPYTHWKWHSLNDPPHLQTVMVDTFSEKQDEDIVNLPEIFDDYDPRGQKTVNEDVIAVELKNFEKALLNGESKKFNPFQIRMKTVKINKQFSLKIIDQTHIHLHFKEGAANLKMNLGIIINPDKVIGVELAEFGSIPNYMFSQKLNPAYRTDSIQLLQKKYNEVNKINWKRIMHDNRVEKLMSVCSADRMLSGISRPLYACSMPQQAYPLPCTCLDNYTDIRDLARLEYGNNRHV